MAKQTIMNIAELKKLLNEIGNEVSNDYEIWLSSDEEGNEFLPMSQNPELCLVIEPDTKRIIFFPLHR
jgi:hypothetical protein